MKSAESPYDPDPPATTPLLVLLAVGVVAWAVFTIVLDLGTFLPQTTEQAAVAASVQRAIVANQNTAIPRLRDSTGAVPEEEIAAMRRRVREVADELLAGTYHDTWIQRFEEIIDLDGSDGFVFSGGADQFTRWRIDVDGNEARARVRARIYLEMSQSLLGRRSTASNVVDFDVGLTRIDGSWLVVSVSQRFAPGGGP